MGLRDALTPVVDEGLGNSANLLGLGDDRALAVDPPRDLRALRQAADKRGLRAAAGLIVAVRMYGTRHCATTPAGGTS